MSPDLQVIDLHKTADGTGFAPAGRMANAIIQITRKKGHCDPQDLNTSDFTHEQIRDSWHMAHSLAKIELKLMSNTPQPSKPIWRRR